MTQQSGFDSRPTPEAVGSSTVELWMSVPQTVVAAISGLQIPPTHFLPASRFAANAAGTTSYYDRGRGFESRRLQVSEP